MEELKNIKFQYYPGNIRLAVPIGTLSLYDFIWVHQNPKPEIMDVFKKIEEAELKGDEELKRELKTSKLFYFTPSAMFKTGRRRRYENIESFTGLAQIDIDDRSPDEIEDIKEWMFGNYPEFYCVYSSPSITGVKGLIRIPICSNVEEYKEYYAGIQEEFEMIDGFDPAPKNLVLPLFLSHDKNILWRESATEWRKKGAIKGNIHPNLNSEPNQAPEYVRSGGEDEYKSDAYYRRITLDIYANKISQIVDNGHPQVRSAALVLGSRVGAGYVNRQEAESFAEDCIRSNSYLSKEPDNYVRTTMWGINQGVNNPRYYK